MTQQILCVDDDPNILRGFERGLRKSFQIQTALDGEKGLELLQEKAPYAVVVSDMQMPGMDGVQFLSRVKEMAPEYLLVLPWHFKESILSRERDYLSSGGKIIFPLPEIEIVGG